MKRLIPNLLTLSRLVMAVAISALLAFYDGRSASDSVAAANLLLLDVALAIFVLAFVTDVLDGYLARRFNVTTAFGRITDPFVDKVLVCGAFAYFAGANFQQLDATGRWLSATGVATWMAVLIISREIFVTGVRGFSESQGQAFTTTVFGKAKMFLQSLAIVWILLVLGRGRDWGAWFLATRDVLIWITVIFTAASAFVYVGRIRLLVSTAPGSTGGSPEAGS